MLDEYARKLIADHSLEVCVCVWRGGSAACACRLRSRALHMHTPMPPIFACLRQLASFINLPPSSTLLYCPSPLQDNFYILDLGTLQRLYRAWGEALPRVHPHYAVKCNPDLAVLATLAALGAGFDCASEAEVRAARGPGGAARG